MFSKHIIRNFSQTAALNEAIKNVTVIGSGLMGAGIAQVAAQTGHNVIMVDNDSTAVLKAQERVNISIQKVAKKKFKDDKEAASKFIEDSFSRLSTSTDSLESVVSADLVVEAVIENLTLKQELFQQLDKVIRIPETSQATFDAMTAWGKAMGKVTVSCKDTPGFIVNRLLIPYSNEAMHMLDRGDATAKDIDTAMKLGAGYPMGPFELGDYVGLDTSLRIIEGWAKDYPENETYRVPPTLRKMVSEGKLGVKSGEGFYKYKK